MECKSHGNYSLYNLFLYNSIPTNDIVGNSHEL